MSPALNLLSPTIPAVFKKVVTLVIFFLRDKQGFRNKPDRRLVFSFYSNTPIALFKPG